MQDGNPIASEVRRTAIHTGIAALLLLLFANQFAFPKAVTNAFEVGDTLFNYVLRIGGAAMALVTIALLSGHHLALVADAAASCAVGAGLAASGALLIVGGGGLQVNFVLDGIFGVMFIASGIRSWRLYGVIAEALRGHRRTAGEWTAPRETVPAPLIHANATPLSDAPSRQSAFPSEHTEPRDPIARTTEHQLEWHDEPQSARRPIRSATAAKDAITQPTPVSSAPHSNPGDEIAAPAPEGGYLAAFAKRKDAPTE